MVLTAGTRIYGFTVERVRRLEELNGTLIEMCHDCGAQLCFMDNQAQNKLFAVAFKTLPQDDTGVFHILEHAVLCGSEKYPVREPFVELLKNSMNTFLNAMTYQDMTLYPVSSRNTWDFLNLTSVYLDAVFAPALLKNPNIFYQEGWHIEQDADGEFSYKGVVFNEMKGAMSEADERIEQEMRKLLFPDTVYRFNYGGDPLSIPDLTYEQFTEAYRQFYHPSNARFFLDGDVPLEETLQMIDAYLNGKDRVHHEIVMQKPVSKEGTAYYEISGEEEAENRSILTMGKILCTWEDRLRIAAAGILCDALSDSNEAPLKRALLSANLAEDLEMAVMDGVAQPYLMIVVRNIADGQEEAVRRTIREAAEQLWKDGLDVGMLQASINRMAFRTKQEPEPQGLYRVTAAMNSWLYGGDPAVYLLHNQILTELRQMAESGGFRELLREMLIEEEGVCILRMLPSDTLGEEQRKTENIRLKTRLEAYTEKDWVNLRQLNDDLTLWQRTPDTPEQLASLPVLPLREVNMLPERIETVETEQNGVKILYHPVPMHGILSLSMYFSMTDVSLEDLTRLSVMPELLGELPTTKHSAAQLQQEIKTYIGSLGFGLEVFAKENNPEVCTPVLMAHAEFLTENKEKAEDLIGEILTETCFDRITEIREIILQIAEEGRHIPVSSGQMLAMTAVQSHYTAQAAVKEAIGGYTFLTWLRNLSENFDGQITELLSLMERTRQRIICKARLTLSVTATEPADISALLTILPSGSRAAEAAAYHMELPMKMGIRIPAQISFAAKGCLLSCCEMEKRGDLWVMSNILSLNHLWNTVRVQGGAYGCGLSVTQNGSLTNYSYRDPSPADSLRAFDEEAEYLQEFCRCNETLDNYIISTIAAADALQSPSAMGLIADGWWFAGISYEERKQNRRQILTANRETLLEWKRALQKMAEDGAVCVVGYEKALQECSGLKILEI